MARIRSVKPEFWIDRFLAKRVSRDARLLYIGLWNLADEHGRLMGDADYLKGQIFPYDGDVTTTEIEGFVDELMKAERVLRYEVDEEPYLFLPNLAKHQRLEPDKVRSRLPAPPNPGEWGAPPPVGPDGSEPRADKSAPRSDRPERDAAKSASAPFGASSQVNQHTQVRADLSARGSDEAEPHAETLSLSYGAWSMEPVAGSMGGVARVRTREARPAARNAPAEKPPSPDGLHELPENFDLTDAMRRWAGLNGFGDIDLDEETAIFIDDRRAKGLRRKNWYDDWQAWIRRARKHQTQRLQEASARQRTGSALAPVIPGPFRRPSEREAVQTTRAREFLRIGEELQAEEDARKRKAQ